jgi:hypothetical protein
MKITYSEQQEIAQEIIGLRDAATLTVIKRDINIGATMFLTLLGRDYNRKARFTDLVASQQYYQLPEDGQKLKQAVANTGGWFVPLEQIPSENAWRKMNMMTVTGQPSHYFIKGNDELGLYPIPSATVADGLELVFSPKHIELTQDDYETGTLTVVNGSQTITGVGTTFTAKLVGQWLQVTDGTDGNWYRISEYTSATSLELENYYQGTSGSAKSYRIGQVADLPEEYLEAPVDYAVYRHFLKRGDQSKAATFKTLFDTAVDMAKETYGQATDNQVINAEPDYRSYNPFRGDPPNSISA